MLAVESIGTVILSNKTEMSSIVLMSHDLNMGGRPFHTDGPQMAKLQSKYVVLVRGTESVCHTFFELLAVMQFKLSVSVCDKGSLVGPCMQDYKSLYASVMSSATLVNIQIYTVTHRQTAFDQLILIAQPAEPKTNHNL